MKKFAVGNVLFLLKTVELGKGKELLFKRVSDVITLDKNSVFMKRGVNLSIEE